MMPGSEKKTNALNLVCLLGHTAGGKTSVAASLAAKMESEIISADSRQVYRGMDIGTGKDIDDYTVDEKQIPYHLIDIVDPGTEYNVYEFQKDFIRVFQHLQERNKIPILCGGTGLYLEAVLKGYKLIRVPVNPELRKTLESMEQEELVRRLQACKNPHNTTDTLIRKRLIRAIEIEEYYAKKGNMDASFPELNYCIFGIRHSRDQRRQRITERLQQRLNSGMIEEVEALLESGVDADILVFYGLEYKFITWFLQGKINREELFNQLNTAIHQFAKRQMTWFRKMEKQGFHIHWIEGEMSPSEKAGKIFDILSVTYQMGESE